MLTAIVNIDQWSMPLSTPACHVQRSWGRSGPVCSKLGCWGARILEGQGECSLDIPQVVLWVFYKPPEGSGPPWPSLHYPKVGQSLQISEGRCRSDWWIFSAVQFSRSVVSDSLWSHGLQHARLPCPSPTLGACSNSCPSSRWCHPTISSSVVPFSSCLQSFPPSGSFLMSQFFASGGQSIGVSASASALPMNIQDWFPVSKGGGCSDP